MNKVPIGITSQRTSANSSFSTLRNCDFNSFSDTAHKQLQGKRFSYQEAHSHQETSQKENKRDNAARPQPQHPHTPCLNHPHTAAQFTALEATDDPMYLCERCAILVASKGFEITKVVERKLKREVSMAGDVKKEAGEAFAALKLRKNQTLEKLDLFANKLDQKADFLEEYFVALHEAIEREKTSLLREVVLRRREIESLREQTTSFYLGLMQRVREINLETGMVGLQKASQLGKELREIKRQTFEVAFDSLKYPVSVRNINQLCQEVAALIREKEYRCPQGSDVEFEFKLKCDEEHSEIRSLKLSFEEENNFTLAQETNRTGQL